jgi:hypothetical protein
MSSPSPTLHNLQQQQEQIREVFSDSPPTIQLPCGTPVSLQLQSNHSYIMNHGSSPNVPSSLWTDFVLLDSSLDLLFNNSAQVHSGTIYIRLYHDSTQPVHVIPLSTPSSTTSTPPTYSPHTLSRSISPEPNSSPIPSLLPSISSEQAVFYAHIDSDLIPIYWGAAEDPTSPILHFLPLERELTESEKTFVDNLQGYNEGHSRWEQGFSVPPELMVGAQILPAFPDGAVPIILPEINKLVSPPLQLVMTRDTIESLAHSQGHPVFDFILAQALLSSPSNSDLPLSPLSISSSSSPDSNSSIVCLPGTPRPSSPTPQPSLYELSGEPDHYTHPDPYPFDHLNDKPIPDDVFDRLYERHLPYIIEAARHAVTWTNHVAATNPRRLHHRHSYDTQYSLEPVLDRIDIPSVFPGRTTSADVIQSLRSSSFTNQPNCWEPFVTTLLHARQASVNVLYTLNRFFTEAGFFGALGYVHETGIDLIQRFPENVMLYFEEWSILYHAFHFFSQHGEQVLPQLLDLILFVPYHEASQLTSFRNNFLSALVPIAVTSTGPEEVD